MRYFARVWEAVQCALPEQLLVEACGKRNLPHEMGLPRWELAGTEEGSK